MPSFSPMGYTTPLLTLPAQGAGGDSFTDTKAAFASDIEHKRLGVTIGLRPWKNTKRWRCKYRGLPDTTIAALKTFFDLRVFILMPYDFNILTSNVRWVESSFEPTYNSPDNYSISFTIEEVVS